MDRFERRLRALNLTDNGNLVRDEARRKRREAEVVRAVRNGGLWLISESAAVDGWGLVLLTDMSMPLHESAATLREWADLFEAAEPLLARIERERGVEPPA